MALTDAAKKVAWRQHYEHLLDVEFVWDRNNLSPAEPIVGPPVVITSKR